MSNFEVLHSRKIKTIVGCIELLKHNIRKKDNLAEFTDTTKSHLNFYSGTNGENFHVKFEELTANLTRKIQKNASHLIEIVISFSPEFSEGWEDNPKLKKKIDSYFNTTEKFLNVRYGYVIISRTDHFDEKTPHSHFLLVPICINKDGNRKFSSSEFLGGRKGLFDLHDQFHKQVGSHFGLERGIRDSRTKHSGLKNYKEWEKSQIIKLEKKETAINDKEDSLKQKEADLTKQEDLLEKQKEEIAQRIMEIDAQKEQLLNLTGNAMESSVRLKNREIELENIEKTQNEQIPQIPIPPAVSLENTRKNWRDKVQSTVDVAFKNLTAVVLSFKTKYDDLLEKYKKMVAQNENYKNRAEKAERDLLEKPLAEIAASRKPSINTVSVKDNTHEHKGPHI